MLSGGRGNDAYFVDAAGDHRVAHQALELQHDGPLVGQVVRRQAGVAARRHELLRFIGDEDVEIAGAQLGQLAARAEPVKRQGGVFARGDDQMHLRRLMFD